VIRPISSARPRLWHARAGWFRRRALARRSACLSGRPARLGRVRGRHSIKYWSRLPRRSAHRRPRTLAAQLGTWRQRRATPPRRLRKQHGLVTGMSGSTTIRHERSQSGTATIADAGPATHLVFTSGRTPPAARDHPAIRSLPRRPGQYGDEPHGVTGSRDEPGIGALSGTTMVMAGGRRHVWISRRQVGTGYLRATSAA
jgi:hypothetical protein